MLVTDSFPCNYNDWGWGLSLHIYIYMESKYTVISALTLSRH